MLIEISDELGARLGLQEGDRLELTIVKRPPPPPAPVVDDSELSPPDATTPCYVRPLAVSIPDAQSLIGVGRTKIWELIGAGEIEVIHIGRRVLIPTSVPDAFIARQSDHRPQPEPTPERPGQATRTGQRGRRR